MPKVGISAPVFPSEDPEKVRAAVLSLFPDSVLELSEGRLEGESPSLERFHEQIRRQRILDSTRSVLRRGTRGDSIAFRLNKQVALVGKVSFIDGEAVLGAIEVLVSDVDPLPFIDALAPETVEGEEVTV